MQRSICAVFSTLTKLFDLILCPFRALAPIWGIAFLALLTAIFVLWIYKLVSNQEAIKQLKKRIQGYFLGIYLFRNDLREILVSEWRVFSNVLRYMGHALLPLAVVIVPVALVCVQMQLRYGYSNPQPGDSVLVSVSFAPGIKLSDTDLKPEPSDGLIVETPPLRMLELNEIYLKISVKEHGKQDIKIMADGSTVDKTVSVTAGVHRLYPVKTKPSFLNCLLYPGQEPIDEKAPIRSVRVDYSSARVNLAGFRLHWSIAYFLLAIVFGIILKPFFKVEF